MIFARQGDQNIEKESERLDTFGPRRTSLIPLKDYVNVFIYLRKVQIPYPTRVPLFIRL